VRFEINPEPMGITFFIDGDRIDEFIPADPDALRQAKFMIDLKVYSEDSSWTDVPDLIFDNTTDGEIWTGSMIKQ